MYAPQPGSTINGVIINSFGSRETKYPEIPKPQKETRIFILGGSAVFVGSEFNNTISSRLESLFLNNDHPDVRVYNFGMLSYNSTQEIIYFINTLVNYKPDIVLMYNGGNDVFTPCAYDPRPGYPHNFFLMEMALSGEKLTKGTIKRQRNALRKKFKVDTRSWKEDIINNYVDNIVKMNVISRGFEFKFMAFLQPLIFFKQTLTYKESGLIGDMGFTNYHIEQYELIRSKLCCKDITYYHDLSNVFKNCTEEIYTDFIHVNDHGNQLIANAIHHIIKDERK